MISDIHERRLARPPTQLAELVGERPRDRPVQRHREDDVQTLFAAAIAELGHLDVLVNNAGLGGTADLVDMTDEQWSSVLDVTLTGTFRMHPRRAAAHGRARVRA